jgi:hypothetical protein
MFLSTVFQHQVPTATLLYVQCVFISSLYKLEPNGNISILSLINTFPFGVAVQHVVKLATDLVSPAVEL